MGIDGAWYSPVPFPNSILNPAEPMDSELSNLGGVVVDVFGKGHCLFDVFQVLSEEEAAHVLTAKRQRAPVLDEDVGLRKGTAEGYGLQPVVDVELVQVVLVVPQRVFPVHHLKSTPVFTLDPQFA